MVKAILWKFWISKEFIVSHSLNLFKPSHSCNIKRTPHKIIFMVISTLLMRIKSIIFNSSSYIESLVVTRILTLTATKWIKIIYKLKKTLITITVWYRITTVDKIKIIWAIISIRINLSLIITTSIISWVYKVNSIIENK